MERNSLTWIISINTVYVTTLDKMHVRPSKSKLRDVVAHNLKDKAIYSLFYDSFPYHLFYEKYLCNSGSFRIKCYSSSLFSSIRYPRLQQIYWHIVMHTLEKIPLLFLYLHLKIPLGRRNSFVLSFESVFN